ncbi:hypothetical protein KR215_003453 [Drosophila sulfurigaster]|nr:hypothetical protein KR215_003453 [Drosophila sulfurigaster]
MVPQTSPQWRQTTGNERTKDAVSVIAARNCATGTATANRTSRTTANRTGMPKTMTATTTTTTTTSKKRFQFLRTSSKAMACQRISPFAPILVLLFVNFGTCNTIRMLCLPTDLVTCSSASDQGSGVEPQLTTFPRSTLPDRPMTTQNDLITTARKSTTLLTAKKPTATITTTTTATATATTAGHSGTSLVMSSTAPTIITTRTTTTTARTAAAARGATKSAQIGLTTKPTAAAAEKQTPSTTATSTTTSATRTMFISTIYPASTTKPTTASPVLPVQMAAATALALTETDARNSIQMAAGKMENKQVAQHEEVELEAEEEEETMLSPHAASADSLTKGFSIPTFLPPFPVFAAADLPAYRAAAAAAEAAAAAAAVAAAAAAAAAASTMASETVTLSPEQQRQQMFNEQHSYLASHNGQLEPGQQPRKNLTMPVLNITAQMGNHAYMPCQIHRLSDKPVSWVRLRDGHIISVDETTFIADERFQSIFQEDHDYTWSLQIKYVQPSDAGWYECQMATEPKLSAKVHLEVISEFQNNLTSKYISHIKTTHFLAAPKTELIGDQSRFVKAGSKVALHCIVRGTLDPPKYIIWFRGQKKISESDERTGWYTQLDRNIFGSIADNQNTIGSLIIPFVRKEDSGNYTCQPSNSVSVSVDLHVLSGESFI